MLKSYIILNFIFFISFNVVKIHGEWVNWTPIPGTELDGAPARYVAVVPGLYQIDLVSMKRLNLHGVLMNVPQARDYRMGDDYEEEAVEFDRVKQHFKKNKDYLSRTNENAMGKQKTQESKDLNSDNTINKEQQLNNTTVTEKVDKTNGATGIIQMNINNQTDQDIGSNNNTQTQIQIIIEKNSDKNKKQNSLKTTQPILQQNITVTGNETGKVFNKSK